MIHEEGNCLRVMRDERQGSHRKCLKLSIEQWSISSLRRIKLCKACTNSLPPTLYCLWTRIIRRFTYGTNCLESHFPIYSHQTRPSPRESMMKPYKSPNSKAETVLEILYKRHKKTITRSKSALGVFKPSHKHTSADSILMSEYASLEILPRLDTLHHRIRVHSTSVGCEDL